MNNSARKRFCAFLHEPKFKAVPPERPLPSYDDQISQKYFEDTTRIDPVSGVLLSDIEVLSDPKTPTILKDYIQQHSARVMVSPGEQIPPSLVEKIDPFDYIVPSDAQTQSELEQYFKETGLKDIHSNNISSFEDSKQSQQT